MNPNEFAENQSAWTYEQLVPYLEKHSWSMDGKDILAASNSLRELCGELDERGLTEYVLDLIPTPSDIEMGGALLSEFGEPEG